MDQARATEISQFASLYTGDCKEVISLENLNAIAIEEDVEIIFDNYDGSFEGLAVCYKGNFYIHIDNASLIDPTKGRGKFTVAHEIGHCLITEHRIGLLSKNLEPHISNYILGDDGTLVKSEIELEADHFASCLLMPEKLFCEKVASFQDNCSFDMIAFLADYFGTSFLATLLRFSDAGPKAVFFTFNREGIVKWYRKGSRFPDWGFKFKVHSSVPDNTLISDVFNKGVDFIGEIRKVDKDDWFHIFDDEYADFELHEQCYYLKSSDYTISMLWFEKN